MQMNEADILENARHEPETRTGAQCDTILAYRTLPGEIIPVNPRDYASGESASAQIAMADPNTVREAISAAVSMIIRSMVPTPCSSYVHCCSAYVLCKGCVEAAFGMESTKG